MSTLLFSNFAYLREGEREGERNRGEIFNIRLDLFHFDSCRVSKSEGTPEQKIIKESQQMSPMLKSPDGKAEVQKVMASNIDEGAWYVCNKVWELLEKPIVNDELPLKERLADVQVIKNIDLV